MDLTRDQIERYSRQIIFHTNPEIKPIEAN